MNKVIVVFIGFVVIVIILSNKLVVVRVVNFIFKIWL